ncbi:MAG: NAD-dependent epimerase/dehydratase family protein, partial [Myxococcota bacterium]|nr:NAD-dependent epimerase/dehydratase family protein [Myxococcota bacterium]
MSAERTALVLGSTGVAGSAAVNELSRQGWRVIAGARRPGEDTREQVTSVALDLLDPGSVRQALAPFSITHVFYCVQYRDRAPRAARSTDIKTIKRQLVLASRMLPVLRWIPGAQGAFYHRIAAESGALDAQHRNLAMVKTVIDVLGQQPHNLEHLAVITGGKHYGMHLGPALYPGHSAPYREDLTPRAPGPNWYYEVEDHLRALDTPWSWSIFRPSFIIGHARNAPYNFGTSLAVYASLRRALGEPLVFFGDQSAYDCQWDVSSARQIAEMMIWSSETAAAHGQAFNCTGDAHFRWRDLWPEIAQWFDLEPAFEPEGISVQRYLKDKGPIWDDLIKEHGLTPSPLRSLVSEGF